jgi:hypothetical protein
MNLSFNLTDYFPPTINRSTKNMFAYRYFSSTRLMSPAAYRFGPLSSRGAFDGVEMKTFYGKGGHDGADKDETENQETPRYVSSLGKNAYALAFGSADLSKILLFNNSGSKPQSPNGADANSSFMKKYLNPEEGGSTLPVSPQGGNKGDFVVPRDFQIKTAYVRKRRHTTHKDADTQSTRSRQSSVVTVFSKHTTNTQ